MRATTDKMASKTTDAETLLPIVKGKLAEKTGLARWLDKEVDKRDNWILQRLADDDKWDYVAEFQLRQPYKGKSEIRDYTNKRGYTSKAHFNGNSYIGSVKKLGTVPVDCQKWEVPSRDKGWRIEKGKFVKHE